MASTTDTTTINIIKSDLIGRSQYRSQYKAKAEVLAAFRESAMSGRAFAEKCGIKYPTFASMSNPSVLFLGDLQTGCSRKGSCCISK